MDVYNNYSLIPSTGRRSTKFSIDLFQLRGGEHLGGKTAAGESTPGRQHWQLDRSSPLCRSGSQRTCLSSLILRPLTKKPAGFSVSIEERHPLRILPKN
jgi:hypothetical protein